MCKNRWLDPQRRRPATLAVGRIGGPCSGLRAGFGQAAAAWRERGVGTPARRSAMARISGCPFGEEVGARGLRDGSRPRPPPTRPARPAPAAPPRTAGFGCGGASGPGGVASSHAHYRALPRDSLGGRSGDPGGPAWALAGRPDGHRGCFKLHVLLKQSLSFGKVGSWGGAIFQGYLCWSLQVQPDCSRVWTCCAKVCVA